MAYLLDAHVVSQVRRSRPDVAVTDWLAGVDADLYLSVIVVGELTRGVELLRRKDPAQAQVHGAWLDALVHDFRNQILPVSLEVAVAWGRLQAPVPRPMADGLLAATALVHDLTVATRNVRDFASTGVRVVNPFTG
jgi:predicted nucleic acid-binding protein